MHELIRWFRSLTKRESEQLQEALSKDTAKRRLKLVLIQDRLELAPDKLEEMKKEIWNVVSKYMVVNEEFMEFDVRRLDELTVLVSNIEVKDLSVLTPAPSA
jgi:cell division topological specificity factor